MFFPLSCCAGDPRLTACVSDPRLLAQGLADIAQYLLLDGAMDDGAHAPVAGWLWWALNPNAVDVGGLVRIVAPLGLPNKG